jgi:hypothetical protein
MNLLWFVLGFGVGSHGQAHQQMDAVTRACINDSFTLGVILWMVALIVLLGGGLIAYKSRLWDIGQMYWNHQISIEEHAGLIGKLTIPVIAYNSIVILSFLVICWIWGPSPCT